MGEYFEPRWTDKLPTIEPTVAIDMRGIERETLVGYWNYLWRLGEYSFRAKYTAGWPAPRGVISLERWAEYHYLKLWPKYGRLWSAVGASKFDFDWRQVRLTPKDVVTGGASRILEPYNIIVRYRERMWWARSVSETPEGKWLYELALEIGYPLMFERRGPGVAKKNEDSWNFGMTWWEAFRKDGKIELYLWAEAEVTYLGMGVRKSATAVSL